MSTASPSQPRLTVALLARNEETCLPKALASVTRIADELLVIDTGSTDQTPAVASEHGARVVDHPWQHDFSAARNAGMAAANGQWVLWLDASEWLAPHQAQSIRMLLDNQQEQNKAWLLYVEIPPEHSHGAAQRVARMRLLPNRPGVRFDGRVRETPGASLSELHIPRELSSITISRGMREHDPERKRARAKRDLYLLDREIPERGPQPGLLCLLGESHMSLGNPAAASQYFRQAVRAAKPGSTEQLEAYYGLLTSIDDAGHDERLNVCLKALDVFPFDAQLLCAMGNYLQCQHRIDLSARAYQSAVQIGQVNPETWHLADMGEVAALCLATTLQLQQQDDQARQVLCDALARWPRSVRLLRSLIELEVKYGRLIDALGRAEKLPAEFPHRDAYRSAIRGACQAARKNWSTAIGYLETAYQAGCRDALCMRNLIVALLATNQRDEAERLAQEWRTLEPGNLEIRHYLAKAGGTSPTSTAHSLPAPHAGVSVGVGTVLPSPVLPSWPPASPEPV